MGARRHDRVNSASRRIFREYARFKIRLREIEKGIVQTSEADSDVADGAPSEDGTEDLRDPKRIVNSNFRLLEQYYNQTLHESRLNSRATIVIASLGFVVIRIGIALVFAGTVAVGTVSTEAGLVAEASTVLFFKNNQEQLLKVGEYHKKLVSTQYLLTAISLAGELDERERQNEAEKIILNLLYLSDELHGSSSTHLFEAERPPGHGIAVAVEPQRIEAPLKEKGTAASREVS